MKKVRTFADAANKALQQSEPQLYFDKLNAYCDRCKTISNDKNEKIVHDLICK
jgi:hypothetical protein